MNATNYYVSTARVVLQGETWQDLYRTLPILRNSLSCTVCSSLLVEPHTPEETDCEHHVCKGCKGGTKIMKPACSWCKDYSKYSENVQLRILIQNYKKLCGLIKMTRLWGQIEKQGEQGKQIMNIVRESEGGQRTGSGTFFRAQMELSEKDNKKEVKPVVKQEPDEVEPPDEIMSSPVSKLNIFATNKDYRTAESVKVKLVEEYNQLSPAVSPPPQTSAISPPGVIKNKIITRKIKETFILNPFKGKDCFKKLDSTSKVCNVLEYR